MEQGGIKLFPKTQAVLRMLLQLFEKIRKFKNWLANTTGW